MKTKEELEALKIEYQKFNKVFSELSKDELKEVVGGSYDDIKTPCPKCGSEEVNYVGYWRGAFVYECSACGNLWTVRK